MPRAARVRLLMARDHIDFSPLLEACQPAVVVVQYPFQSLKHLKSKLCGLQENRVSKSRAGFFPLRDGIKFGGTLNGL
jgi:hypothetical protein